MFLDRAAPAVPAGRRAHPGFDHSSFQRLQEIPKRLPGLEVGRYFRRFEQSETLSYRMSGRLKKYVTSIHH
jgi:hypothetical protein